MRWTIPNILTLLRLLAAPGVALVFAFSARPLALVLAISLFLVAAITDYIDGRLARAWAQESNFGRMLDPIADKAIVIIALSVITALSGLTASIVIPVSLILLREVFVSGLREYLGAAAGTLKVTKLAKWKTTAQMVAIPILFAAELFPHSGAVGGLGIVLIWTAMLLTVVTGLDYLRKAAPYLKDQPS